MDNALDRIIRAKSLGELWRAVRTYYRAQGFGAIAYCAAVEPLRPRSQMMAVMGYGFPKEIADAYLRYAAGEYDPVPRIALERGVPVRWRQVWRELVPSAKELRMYEALRALELGDGLGLPVYGPGGRNAAVLVGRAVSEDRLEAAPALQMQMIAQAAHLRMCAMMPERPELLNPLSAREREILEWVAHGKSNSVIAEILQISAATVDTYLRRIYEKLEVADRTSAAVKGVGMGLIVA